MGKIAGEVRAVVGRAVFAESAGDKDLRVTVRHCELDVGVGLVVAEEDVKTRLALLDKVVFKGEGLVFVGDGDVIDVDGLTHESAGFGVGLGGFEKIGAYAGT